MKNRTTFILVATMCATVLLASSMIRTIYSLRKNLNKSTELDFE